MAHLHSQPEHIWKWLNWPFSLNHSASLLTVCYHKMTSIIIGGSTVHDDSLKNKWWWYFGLEKVRDERIDEFIWKTVEPSQAQWVLCDKDVGYMKWGVASLVDYLQIKSDQSSYMAFENNTTLHIYSTLYWHSIDTLRRKDIKFFVYFYSSSDVPAFFTVRYLYMM